MRKSFTQDGRIDIGINTQISGYWVTWKITVSNFLPLVEIPHRPLCGLLRAFGDILDCYLFRPITSQKGVKCLQFTAVSGGIAVARSSYQSLQSLDTWFLDSMQPNRIEYLSTNVTCCIRTYQSGTYTRLTTELPSSATEHNCQILYRINGQATKYWLKIKCNVFSWRCQFFNPW